MISIWTRYLKNPTQRRTLESQSRFISHANILPPRHSGLTLYSGTKEIDGVPELLLEYADGESFALPWEVAMFLKDVMNSVTFDTDQSKILYKLQYANLTERFGLHPITVKKSDFQYDSSHAFPKIYSFTPKDKVNEGDLILTFIIPDSYNKLEDCVWKLAYWGSSYMGSPLLVSPWKDLEALRGAVELMQDEEAARSLFALVYPELAATLAQKDNDDYAKAELIKRIGDWDGIEGALETNSYPLFIPKVPNSILGKELRSDKFSGFLNPEFRKKNFVHTVYLNSRVRVNLGWAIQLKYGSQATHRKKNNESALIEALRNLEDWQVFGIDESKKILPTYNSLHFGTIFVMPTQIVELLGEYIYLLKDFMEFDNTETKSWF